MALVTEVLQKFGIDRKVASEVSSAILKRFKPVFKYGIATHGGADLTDAELTALLTGGDTGSVVTGITAGTTQTQGGATALTGRYNNVTTVTTAGDGVKLPTATAGLSVRVRNSATNTLKIYPFSGDAIEALSANAAAVIPGGAEILFTAIDATTWKTSTRTAVYTTDLEIGSTFGGAPIFKIYSGTAAKGDTILTMADNTGNTETEIRVGAQAASRTYTVPDAGASAEFVMTTGAQAISGKTSIASTVLQAGASGGVGVVNVYPPTAASGYLSIGCSDQATNVGSTVTLNSQAAARAYTIPDAGASAEFVMAAGAQTIAGAKLFTSPLVARAAIASTRSDGVLAGSIGVESITSGHGSVALQTQDNTGDTVTIVESQAQAAARTYKINDWSTKASSDVGVSLAGIRIQSGTSTTPGAVGCLLVDTGDNNKLYICTTASATAATWTLVGSQS